MKLSRGPTQESHEATRARIIAAAENKDVSAPAQRLVAVRDWVTSLWRLKNWIDNSRGWFWILVAIALIVLCILAMISKVWHPQPEYDCWLKGW
jgi:hypothetical protein